MQMNQESGTTTLEQDMVKRERERERNRTIPPGNVPGLVDRCIISSNWNVFEPGAAHTATKQKK